jgi:hypothetical protein
VPFSTGAQGEHRSPQVIGSLFEAQTVPQAW